MLGPDEVGGLNEVGGPREVDGPMDGELDGDCGVVLGVPDGRTGDTAVLGGVTVTLSVTVTVLMMP